jgi:hypothetical protein
LNSFFKASLGSYFLLYAPPKRCRCWSLEYIKKQSSEAAITGIEKIADCFVPEKELMVAFKIHSARRTDVRDIIMMMEGSDLDKVLTHLRRGMQRV